MKTLKQIKEEHAIELDKAWNEKYPYGQFVLQEIERSDWDGDKKCSFNHRIVQCLNWNERRRTSHVSYKGISAYTDKPHWICGPNKTRIINGINVDNYQGSSFGKCRIYKTMGELCKAANKRKFHPMLIEVFAGEWQNWKNS